MKNKYSFTLVVKPYKRENCTLDDMRVIYNGNTCLIAKNSKHGGLYLHPNAKIIKGSFHKVAGSVRYPVLLAKNEVHIQVKDFHSKANIKTNQHVKQDIIKIIDCNY
jgi:hypothetical protein